MFNNGEGLETPIEEISDSKLTVIGGGDKRISYRRIYLYDPNPNRSELLKMLGLCLVPPCGVKVPSQKDFLRY